MSEDELLTLQEIKYALDNRSIIELYNKEKNKIIDNGIKLEDKEDECNN